MALERDGDGYLMSMADWSEDAMHEMAKADDYELTPEKIEQIMKAREYYDENSTVPAIRVFAKYIGMDKKDMFKMWLTGPMKPITKYGGLPKPTGCVQTIMSEAGKSIYSSKFPRKSLLPAPINSLLI